MEANYKTDLWTFFAVLLVQEVTGFLKNTRLGSLAWYFLSRRVCPPAPEDEEEAAEADPSKPAPGGEASNPASERVAAAQDKVEKAARAQANKSCGAACRKLASSAHPYGDEEAVEEALSYGTFFFRVCTFVVHGNGGDGCDVYVCEDFGAGCGESHFQCHNLSEALVIALAHPCLCAFVLLMCVDIHD